VARQHDDNTAERAQRREPVGRPPLRRRAGGYRTIAPAATAGMLSMDRIVAYSAAVPLKSKGNDHFLHVTGGYAPPIFSLRSAARRPGNAFDRLRHEAAHERKDFDHCAPASSTVAAVGAAAPGLSNARRLALLETDLLRYNSLGTEELPR
jgi:hypothetical protein